MGVSLGDPHTNVGLLVGFPSKPQMRGTLKTADLNLDRGGVHGNMGNLVLINSR